MKCLFIYNPFSGKGKMIKHAESVRKILSARFDTVDVRPSEKIGDLSAFSREACGKYDALVFAGGDGTFNDVLQGLAGQPVKPLLGYIPTGTCNDIARTYGISFRIKRAAKQIVGGVPKEIDCFKVNDHYAEYVVCAGAFTTTTYETDQQKKRKFGRIAYFYDGIRKNLKPPVFKVSVKTENGEFKAETNFITFINSRSVAGFPINRHVVLDDGLVDMLCVKLRHTPKHNGKIRAFFKVLKIFLFGLGKTLMRDSDIIKLRGNHFEVTASEDVCWNYDGERGDCGTITLDVLQRNVSLLLPAKSARKMEKKKSFSK